MLRGSRWCMRWRRAKSGSTRRPPIVRGRKWSTKTWSSHSANGSMARMTRDDDEVGPLQPAGEHAAGDRRGGDEPHDARAPVRREDARRGAQRQGAVARRRGRAHRRRAALVRARHLPHGTTVYEPERSQTAIGPLPNTRWYAPPSRMVLISGHWLSASEETMISVGLMVGDGRRHRAVLAEQHLVVVDRRRRQEHVEVGERVHPRVGRPHHRRRARRSRARRSTRRPPCRRGRGRRTRSSQSLSSPLIAALHRAPVVLGERARRVLRRRRRRLGHPVEPGHAGQRRGDHQRGDGGDEPEHAAAAERAQAGAAAGWRRPPATPGRRRR